MGTTYYVGLDIHKKTISYCVKLHDGKVVDQGRIAATQASLVEWAGRLPGPWTGAMEATLFSRWIYDTLHPYAKDLEVAHPALLVALTASKKKNDRKDAATIADLLRAGLLPRITLVSREVFELRLVLRYRNLLVREVVRIMNKTHGLLMECGIEYERTRLKGKKYFAQLLDSLDNEQYLVGLMKHSRSLYEQLTSMQKALLAQLHSNERLRQRVERLMTVPGVGEITALTWALEIGPIERMRSVKKAQSYCGLCAAQSESAGKTSRGPISKKRNKHLQKMLIEAAKLAPRRCPALAALYQREKSRSHANRATIAVARKLVAWLMAVDRSAKDFEPRTGHEHGAAGAMPTKA